MTDVRFARSTHRGYAYSYTAIPKCHIILPPLEADVNLLSSGDYLVEILDYRLALGLGNANDFGNEPRVEG